MPKSCATLLCRACVDVNHMCSRTVSDTANRLRKTRKKKSSAVPLFRSGHMSVICARLGSKGKVGVQRGRETAGVPSFLPSAAGAARSRRPQTANPPLRFSEKLPARQGRTRLRQFACPAQPVQKKEPPVRGEPACGSSCAPVSRCRKGAARQGRTRLAAVRTPRLSRCRKGAARQGRTRLRQFVCPGHLVPRKEKHRRIASTVLKVCTFTQIAAAYRHPYAPAPAGPVPDDRAR